MATIAASTKRVRYAVTSPGWSGQLIHEIAAAYVVNPGRVSNVLNEVKHVGSKEVAASKRLCLAAPITGDRRPLSLSEI